MVYNTALQVLLSTVYYYLSGLNTLQQIPFLWWLRCFLLLVFLVLFYFTGVARRKQLGGYADFKEIFQAILLAIVITELSYAIFNFVYLKYIEPGFFDRFSQTSKLNFKKAGWTDERIGQQMDKLKDAFTQLSPVNALKGMGMWIVIDCIFGLIFSTFLKRISKIFRKKYNYSEWIFL
ncbi:MAG: DUF4199 domain-containing protein [Segetibacter sp.]